MAVGAVSLGFDSLADQIGLASNTVLQRLATAATFLLCCPGANPRKWPPQTRYTLRRITASIMKIWDRIPLNFCAHKAKLYFNEQTKLTVALSATKVEQCTALDFFCAFFVLTAHKTIVR